MQKNMKLLKKPLFITILLTLLTVSYSVVINIYIKSSIKNYLSKSDVSTTSISYIIGEYDGKVAVFKENDDSPVEIFNAYTNMLPLEDAKALKSGIRVHSEDELNRIIEDYIS